MKPEYLRFLDYFDYSIDARGIKFVQEQVVAKHASRRDVEDKGDLSVN